MVEAPEQYPWSSARHHLGIERCDWLDEDSCYVALGNDAIERHVRHCEFLAAAIPEGEWRLIRTAVQRGQLTGSGRFIDEVERILGRRIEHRKPGRPMRRPDK